MADQTESHDKEMNNQNNPNLMSINNKAESDFNSNYYSQNQNQSRQDANEEHVVWELEVWRRAEQTKFKAYLKQLEYEFLTKLSDEYKLKEDEREKEIRLKINELNILQTRVKKKASELEGRENKVTLMEEELKIKMNEVVRQLANKEEEIIYYQKRFKENKNDLEKEKMSLVKQNQEKDKEYRALEENFKKYKKEIEESPVSVLKHELNRKSLEMDDQMREKERVNGEKDKYKTQCEKLKIELIKMKKLFDGEKEAMYKQKIDEIEKLRFEIYNQKISQNEISELQELRVKMKSLTNKGDNNEEGKENSKVEQNSVQIKKKEYKVVTITKKIKNSFGGSQTNNFNNINVKSELDKMNQERMSLLNSGMYTENDDLIIHINDKIKRLQEMEY